MDQIIIKELEIYCNHGVYKEEKVLGQKFLVSAVLYTDTKRAGKSDKIEYSVNYGEVCHRIREIMERNTFDLIERVAETIAERLLKEFDLIKKTECFCKNREAVAPGVYRNRFKYGGPDAVYKRSGKTDETGR